MLAVSDLHCLHLPRTHISHAAAQKQNAFRTMLVPILKGRYIKHRGDIKTVHRNQDRCIKLKDSVSDRFYSYPESILYKSIAGRYRPVR